MTAALLGKDAPGLSASTVGRLKESWQQDYDLWGCKRSLVGRRYVYIWADGIHSNVRLGKDDRVCMLVVMVVTLDGTKELIAVESGYRENTISWKSVLLGLRGRGMDVAPELAAGDGALGFWAQQSSSAAGYIKLPTLSISAIEQAGRGQRLAARDLNGG